MLDTATAQDVEAVERSGSPREGGGDVAGR